jgi:hypothetical protein
VTKGEMLGRLEVLLDRVRARAAEPRREKAEARQVIVEAEAPRQETAVPESAPEEVRGSDSHDSRERLVAAEPAAPEAAPAERVALVRESAPPVDMADLEVVAEDEEPLHTPPPESGRLPAAPVTEFDPDITGVRNATPLLPRRAEEPVRHELVAEAIRPQLVRNDAVAEMITQAQQFAPATFVELLEASLAL